MTRTTLRTRLAAVVAVGVMAIAATGCGSSSKSSTQSTTAPSTATKASGSTQTAASMKASVQIVNFSFKPSTITVKVGGTVTWKQVDQTGHSVKSSSTPPAWKTSNVLKPGQTFSHTFTKAGTYKYICGVHNYMMGEVVAVK